MILSSKLWCPATCAEFARAEFWTADGVPEVELLDSG